MKTDGGKKIEKEISSARTEICEAIYHKVKSALDGVTTVKSDKFSVAFRRTSYSEMSRNYWYDYISVKYRAPYRKMVYRPLLRNPILVNVFRWRKVEVVRGKWISIFYKEMSPYYWHQKSYISEDHVPALNECLEFIREYVHIIRENELSSLESCKVQVHELFEKINIGPE